VTSHADEHPEPEEGCRECAHTSRPRPGPAPTIDELLSRARLNFGYTPQDIVDSRRRIEGELAGEYQAFENPGRTTEPELAELLAVEGPEPRQLRRIAELVEVLHGDDVARVWWAKAAAAGDQDAIDYMHVMNEEDEEDD
jgi:hypothetical protein